MQRYPVCVGPLTVAISIVVTSCWTSESMSSSLLRPGVGRVVYARGIQAISASSSLRRTFASKLKQRGVDSMVVARLLGHTTSRLVDTVYGHLDLGTLRGAMELI